MSSTEGYPIERQVSTFDFIDASLLLLFRLFQRSISDIDDHTCPMYPTCSQYGVQAVQKYGFLLGSLKTLDRLHRCNHDHRLYKTVIQGERVSYNDTP